MRKLFKLIIVLIAGILFALFTTAERDAEDSENIVDSEPDVTARLWNPRGKSDELIAERARFLAQAAETRTAKQKEVDKTYMERYKDAIGKTGGAVCVNGVGAFLSEDANAQVDTIAEHVQHIADLIGKQGTCYGSDFTHNLEEAMFIQLPMVDKNPLEKGFGAPSQMASIEDIWAIVAVLEKNTNGMKKRFVGS